MKKSDRGYRSESRSCSENFRKAKQLQDNMDETCAFFIKRLQKQEKFSKISKLDELLEKYWKEEKIE